jgi:uncharacterized protein (TIGR02996 family)
MSIALVRAALARGDEENALQHALSAWQTQPSPALGRVIRALSERVATESPAFLTGSGDLAVEAWLMLAERAKPEGVPALIATLSDVPPEVAVQRLELVASWPSDPRVDEWCVAHLERLPAQPRRSERYWLRHLDRLEQIADAALLPRLEALHGLWRSQQGRTVRGWLGRHLGRLLPRLRLRLRGDEPDDPELIELERSLQAAPEESDLLVRLLACVYADPEALAPRLVYADALVDRGDPRGEFILLQCQRPDDPDARARAQQLLEEHLLLWLGELRPLLRSDGLVFEEGFLARCHVRSPRADLHPERLQHPAFATVRALTGSVRIGLRRDLRSLRELEFDAQSAVENEGLQRPWVELLSGEARPIEALEYNPSSELPSEEIELLMCCASLPRLRRLTLEYPTRELLQRLCEAPVLDRLHLLGLSYESADWSELVPLCARAPVPELELHLRVGRELAELLLVRGPAGYDTVEGSLHPQPASTQRSLRQAEGFLQRLAQLRLPLQSARIALHDAQQIELIYRGLLRMGVASPQVSLL